MRDLSLKTSEEGKEDWKKKIFEMEKTTSRIKWNVFPLIVFIFGKISFVSTSGFYTRLCVSDLQNDERKNYDSNGGVKLLFF